MTTSEALGSIAPDPLCGKFDLGHATPILCQSSFLEVVSGPLLTTGYYRSRKFHRLRHEASLMVGPDQPSFVRHPGARGGDANQAGCRFGGHAAQSMFEGRPRGPPTVSK